MAASRDRARLYSDGGFIGHALLAEQTALLSDSTPSDINFLYFLKLRLSAQQRATAQRNRWQQARRDTCSMEATLIVEQSPVQCTDTASAASVVSHTRCQTMSMDRAVSPAVPEMDYSANGSCVPATGSVAKDGGGRANSLEEADAFDTSHDLGGGRRQASRPGLEVPEEPLWQVAAAAAGRSISTYNIGAMNSSIEDRPAMASGTPQVPVGVDEMKGVALEPCMHCGRTFAPGRLARHVKTCERHVDGGAPKTKADSSHSSSVVSGRYRSTTTSTTAAAPGTPSASPAPANRTASAGTATRAPGAAVQTEKWRKQSAQVRSAMAGGSAAVADDRVPCPSCGRRFSEDAAARHMPMCKSKSGRLA